MSMKTKELYDEFLITSMVAGFEPIELASARGTRVVASDGREYLDCFSGIAVVNTGHGHPAVLAAARAQMELLVHGATCVYYNPRAGELGKRLAEIAPGSLRKTFFSNSGAEAIEGALRLAKQFTGRREIVALTHGFHGRTAATLSITGNRERKRRSGPYMSGVAFAPAPYLYRCPFRSKTAIECAERCAEAVVDVLRYHTSGDVAAFVAEPVLGEGGIIVPHERYFQRVKEILDAEGILFIVDEVQTGFGRTGKMFGIEHSGVAPDIMATAKGIASGFPLGAFTARADIAAAFKPGDHLSTFGGNPVSCAAALATIDVLQQEKLVENSAARGAQILTRLTAFQERCALVGDVRGRGLMIGVELVRDAAKTPAAEEAREVKRLCREAGVLVGVGGPFANVVRLQPPLVIDEADAARACDVVEKALSQLAR